jgi:hypothetical protein
LQLCIAAKYRRISIIFDLSSGFRISYVPVYDIVARFFFTELPSSRALVCSCVIFKSRNIICKGREYSCMKFDQYTSTNICKSNTPYLAEINNSTILIGNIVVSSNQKLTFCYINIRELQIMQMVAYNMERERERERERELRLT